MTAPVALPFVAQARVDAPDNPLAVGQLGSAHGIQGWIKIHSYTEPADNLFHYAPWFCQWQQHWYMLSCDNWRRQGKSYVGHLISCDDRNLAALYTNLDLYIPRTLLPEPDSNEYYWHDLQGLQVINQNGIKLGVIDHLFNSGASDIMVIIGDKERLLPYVLEDIVVKVDLTNRCIHVIWDPEF